VVGHPVRVSLFGTCGRLGHQFPALRLQTQFSAAFLSPVLFIFIRTRKINVPVEMHGVCLSFRLCRDWHAQLAKCAVQRLETVLDHIDRSSTLRQCSEGSQFEWTSNVTSDQKTTLVALVWALRKLLLRRNATVFATRIRHRISEPAVPQPCNNPCRKP